MSGKSTMSMDRRAFLGRVTVSVGGVVMGALLPASLLQAGERCLPAVVYHDPCGDWTVDDVFTAYPPYSFHIAPPPPQSVHFMAPVDPVDRNFIV